jgi:hypothetical protein
MIQSLQLSPSKFPRNHGKPFGGEYLSDGEERVPDAEGDGEQDQSEGALEAAPLGEVPLHEREPAAADADLRSEPHRGD